MNTSLSFFIQLARTYTNMTRKLDIVLSSVHGLSFSDFTMLYKLQQAPEQKLRRIDLAERMGLTASGVTRSLLPMEKLGWVTRESDARDARVAYAVLTPEGATLLDNAMLTASERCDALLRGMPSTQLNDLQDLLAHIAN
jgi:DNA-binding MarR family transcriptional regulator